MAHPGFTNQNASQQQLPLMQLPGDLAKAFGTPGKPTSGNSSNGGNSNMNVGPPLGAKFASHASGPLGGGVLSVPSTPSGLSSSAPTSASIASAVVASAAAQFASRPPGGGHRSTSSYNASTFPPKGGAKRATLGSVVAGASPTSTTAMKDQSTSVFRDDPSSLAEAAIKDLGREQKHGERDQQ